MHETTDLDRPDFESQINAALETYANADSGLEQRVLARIVDGRASAGSYGLPL
jgi:hypothetical protein